jgi:transposase
MSRKKRYIENLTADQVSALENGFKYGKTHHYRSRCQCILLSYSGKSVPELCEFYQKSHLTIYNWFNRWESEGLSGLEIRSGRGRKRKLDFDNSDHVKLVQQSLRLENRNLKQLQNDLESKLGLELSRSSLRRFLKRLVTDTSDLERA